MFRTVPNRIPAADALGMTLEKMMKTIIAICMSLPLLAAFTSIMNEKAQALDNNGSFAADHSIESMGSAFFRMMDSDGDGIVTKSERDAVPHQEWMADFSKVDLNGDGVLSEAEYVEALSRIHAAAKRREA